MGKGNRPLTFILFLIAMVSIGWGVAFLSLALLMKSMAPMQVLAARWGITALVFLGLVVSGRIRLRLRGKNPVFLFLTGLCEPCAYSILEAYGIKMTSASTSAIFVASIPSMTLVLGIFFFGHRANSKLVISLIITFLGVITATFFSPGFAMSGTRAGMICMAAGVIAASLYSLSSKKASEDFDPASITAIMAFEGAILFNGIAFAKGYGLDTFIIPFSDWQLAAHLLFLSLFCAFGSYFCYNQLLKLVDAALITNVVSSLSTIIGVVCGILFMGDLWGWYTVLGMAVTLAGVWLATSRMREDIGTGSKKPPSSSD